MPVETLLLVTLQDGSALRGEETNVLSALTAWNSLGAGRAYPLQTLESGRTLLLRAINPASVALITEVPAGAR